MKESLKKPEVSFWIGLIIPLIAVGVAWGVNNTRLTNLEGRFGYFSGRFLDRTNQVDARLSKQDDVLLDIQVRLAEIQKDILYIRNQIE